MDNKVTFLSNEVTDNEVAFCEVTMPTYDAHIGFLNLSHFSSHAQCPSTVVPEKVVNSGFKTFDVIYIQSTKAKGNQFQSFTVRCEKVYFLLLVLLKHFFSLKSCLNSSFFIRLLRQYLSTY